MKLILKSCGQDRKLLLLCDEAGAPLPCQRNLTFKQPIDGVQTVTVEFVVDMKSLVLD